MKKLLLLPFTLLLIGFLFISAKLTKYSHLVLTKTSEKVNENGDFIMTPSISHIENPIVQVPTGLGFAQVYSQKPSMGSLELLNRLRYNNATFHSNSNNLALFDNQLFKAKLKSFGASARRERMQEEEGDEYENTTAKVVSVSATNTSSKEKSTTKKSKKSKKYKLFADVMPDIQEDSVEFHITSTDKDFSKFSTDSLNKFQKNLIEFSKQYLGVRYKWGGTTEGRGFDCSGFVQYVYSQMGVTLPRTSHNMSKLGVAVSSSKCKPGDLVYFGKKRDNTYKTKHIGIVVSNENGKVTMIHSARKRGVVVSEDIFSSSYYRKNFLFIKRIL